MLPGGHHSAETRAKIRSARMGKPRRYVPVGTTCGAGAYLMVKVAEPRSWRREHLVVYEAANGQIPPGCVVHHIDGDGHNNALENLQMMTRGEHTKLNHLRGP